MPESYTARLIFYRLSNFCVNICFPVAIGYTSRVRLFSVREVFSKKKDNFNKTGHHLMTEQTLKSVPLDNFLLLDDYAFALEAANAAEAEARDAREKIENKLAELLGHREQKVTFESDDYKTATRSSIRRTVTNLSVMSVADELGQDLLVELFPFGHRLDLTAYFDLKKTDPAKFLIASRAVIATEARPEIKVTRRSA